MNCADPCAVCGSGTLNQTINRNWPVKGGLDAGSTSAGRYEEATSGTTMQLEGPREIFMHVRRGAEGLETPVWHAGESGELEEAMAVFTSREKALLYLQAAGWEQTFEPTSLSPSDLGAWLREATEDGIDLVVVDPNRQAHLRGEPQPTLILRDMVDPSDDNLYNEILALGRA